MTARTSTGDTLTDDDVANLGVGADLVVKKAINAADPLHPSLYEDADFALSPVIVRTGSTVTFTYIVYAVGGASITNVKVVDNNGTAATGDDFSPTYVSGDTDADGILDPGEVWLYRATRTSLYTNIATATGLLTGETKTASDPASYRGDDVPKILIQKAVNAVNPTAPTAAEDANSVAAARLIASGAPVVWTYLV